MPAHSAPLSRRPHALALPLALLSLAGCGNGVINMRVNMPGPGGASQSGEVLTLSSGVIVDAKDGTDVCERLRAYYYRPASPPAAVAGIPKDQPPLYSGRGLGKYDPEKRQCQVLGVVPPGDYWVAVEYPVQSPTDSSVTYYTTARPSLTPVRLTGGAYPVHVVEKQTAEGTIDLTASQAPMPGSP